jgi:hypothetical protein
MVKTNKPDLFFPSIKRRNDYPKSNRGEFYADYAVYREHIRQDCLGRCVYCDSHENENGGPKHMNLDHFRPKSLLRFSYLINDPGNLVWTCSGCNSLKGNKWPDENLDDCVIGNIGFVDPFLENYKNYFEIQPDGSLKPKKSPAEYMIAILALNRPSKRKIRELRLIKYQLIDEFDKEISRVSNLLPKLSEVDRTELETHIQWLNDCRCKIIQLLDFEIHDDTLSEEALPLRSI